MLSLVLIGTKMLNRCPKLKSCGGYNPIWTDSAVPIQINVISNITAYAAGEDNCKSIVVKLQVTRCSRDSDDLIYRYVGEPVVGKCRSAFCSMK